MTAETEQKAQDLWLTYYELLPDGIYSDHAAKAEAKKFALIAVQTVLDFIKEKFIPHAGAIHYLQDDDYKEYQSIKSHLQNL